MLTFTTLPDARLLTSSVHQLRQSPVQASTLAHSLLEELVASSQQDQQTSPEKRLVTPVQAQNCGVYLLQDDCVVAPLNEKNAADA